MSNSIPIRAQYEECYRDTGPSLLGSGFYRTRIRLSYTVSSQLRSSKDEDEVVASWMLFILGYWVA